MRPRLEALAVALVGGVFMAWLHVPLAWMLGAMFTTTAAVLAGRRLEIPDSWRAVMISVLGVLLGSWVTPELVAAMPGWWPSLVALPLYVVGVGALTYPVLRSRGGLDPVSAFFAAAPGGLSEMILAGERAGGDARAIALVHTVRLFLVVAIIPLTVRVWLGVQGTSRAGMGWPPLVDLAWLAGAAVLGLWVGRRLRMPAGPLVGPLVASAVLHLTGIVHTAPPFEVIVAAQIVVGASIGVRFVGVGAGELIRATVRGAASTVVMLTTTAIIAGVLFATAGIPLVAGLLAFVPGGLAEMSLIALTLHADPAFVVAHHIVRIALVVGLATPLLLLLRSRL